MTSLHCTLPIHGHNPAMMDIAVALPERSTYLPLKNLVFVVSVPWPSSAVTLWLCDLSHMTYIM